MTHSPTTYAAVTARFCASWFVGNVKPVGHVVDRAERAEIGQHLGQADIACLSTQSIHFISSHAEGVLQPGDLILLRHQPDQRLDRPATDLLARGDVEEESPEES